jgi:Uma2 family endonuclease
MTAAEKLELMSVEDYLTGELNSTIKHEYLGGMVYAHKCRPFNSDTKIRVRLPTHLRFYYSDASVVCRPNAPDDSFQDEPAVIVEVMSDATRRIDEGEKKDAYLTIPITLCLCAAGAKQARRNRLSPHRAGFQSRNLYRTGCLHSAF